MIEMKNFGSSESSPKEWRDIVVMWCSTGSSESLPSIPWRVLRCPRVAGPVLSPFDSNLETTERGP